MAASSSTDYSLLKVAELRARLGSRGLPKSGKKSELIARLQAADGESDSEEEPIAKSRKRKHRQMNAENDESESADDSTTVIKRKRRKRVSYVSSDDSSEHKSGDEKEDDADEDEIEEDSDKENDTALMTESMGSKSKTVVTTGTGEVLKIACYNLNGVRAAAKKGLAEYISTEDADVVCFSEVKAELSQNPVDFAALGYENVYWNASKSKKGYAGVCVVSKRRALSVEYNVGHAIGDAEGRTVALEFDSFILLNTYVPNSGQNLKFKSKRQTWDKHMYAFVKEKQQLKPCVWTGDLNVAIRDCDVYDGDSNPRREKTAGFTPYERSNFRKLLGELRMADAFAELYPAKRKKELFTFYSKRFKSLKPSGKGWRLDYFVVSASLLPLVRSVEIRHDVDCSDHIPLILQMEIPKVQ